MGVTIYDIAREAGVSIATVSRVVNGHERVADATREQVLAVALELGYQPHASARSLARRRSNVIAAVIPMLTNYFFIEVLRGVQDRMAESDFDLLVFSARTLDEVGDQLDRALAKGRSAGVLLFSSPLDPERTRQIIASGQPVTLVDETHEAFDAVSTDNLLGGQLAVRHLLDRGARRIALIMARPESIPAADRHEGYRIALGEHGIDCDPALVVVSEDGLYHGYSEAAGYEAMQRLLRSGGPAPDAVFATSDVQALGAMRALQEAGIRVPEDMLVVGFDDIMISRHLGLSTVRQPMYEMGRLGADKLFARIENPGHEVSHTILAPRLVVRRSSGVPSTAPTRVAS
jgi:LacI family transcriptional regulator